MVKQIVKGKKIFARKFTFLQVRKYFEKRDKYQVVVI